MTRVIVTGAAGGIGSAAIAELRSRGAQVIGLDLVADEDVLACDVRDLATTRNGAIGYALMRHIRRRLLDAIVRRRLTRLAAAGHFDSSPLRRLASRP